MKRSLITIVVPVFNIERYVEKCAASLLAQSYGNIEIILVDDGSTDGSASICDKLQSEHGRISAIHQENRGLSAARNKGLSLATGEYVVFVDGDDYVSPMYVEALYRAMEDSACFMAAVSGGCKVFDGDSLDIESDADSSTRYQVVPEVEYQADLLYQKRGNGAPWRMYRRAAMNETFFPEGLFFEDLATTYKYVHGRGPVAVLDSRRLYAYRQRSGSIMRSSASKRKVESCVAVTSELYENVSKWYPELIKAASSRCFSVNRSVYSTISSSDDLGRSIIWKQLIDHRSIVLFDSDARKRERAAALFACLGQRPFDLFCKAYVLYRTRH